MAGIAGKPVELIRVDNDRGRRKDVDVVPATANPDLGNVKRAGDISPVTSTDHALISQVKLRAADLEADPIFFARLEFDVPLAQVEGVLETGCGAGRSDINRAGVLPLDIKVKPLGGFQVKPDAYAGQGVGIVCTVLESHPGAALFPTARFKGEFHPMGKVLVEFVTGVGAGLGSRRSCCRHRLTANGDCAEQRHHECYEQE